MASGFLAYPAGFAKPLILFIEAFMTLSIAVTLAHAGRRSATAGAPAMTRGDAGRAYRRGAGGSWPLRPHHKSAAAAQDSRLQSDRQRRFPAVRRHRPQRRGAGFAADPVPQAMVITGIVVAFAATALAIALVLRLFEETGRVTLRSDAWDETS